MNFMRVLPSRGLSIACALGIVVGLTGVTSEALAGTPIRARRMLMHVTTAYDVCTVPDTTSDSTGGPACLAPVQGDPICKFDVRGRGKVKLAARPDDVRFIASLKGIDGACEGETLQVRMSFRITSDDCGNQACTLADVVNTPIATCKVSAGKCAASGLVNPAISGLIGPDKETFVQVLGCDFKRTTGVSIPNTTFACGLMVP